MGSYSTLRIGKFELNWKHYLPPILSYLFDSNDKVINWERDDDEESYLDNAGYETTVVKAFNRLDTAGYNYDFLKGIYEFFVDEIDDMYMLRLNEIYSLDNIHIQEDLKFSSALEHNMSFQESNIENDINITIKFLVMSINNSVDDIVLNMMGIKYLLPPMKFETIGDLIYIDNADFQTYIHDNILIIPKGIFRVLALFGDEYFLDYSDIQLIIMSYFLLSIIDDQEIVGLYYSELLDDDNLEDDLSMFHKESYEILQKKARVYQYAFKNILKNNYELRIRYTKDLLSEKWKNLLIEKNSYTKGELLESFICETLSMLDDIHIQDRRLNVGDEEIDIVLRNHISDPFWSSLNSSFIIVECKNWSTSIGVKEVRDFESKLRNHSNLARVGIVFSSRGYSKECFEFIKRLGRDDPLIILISGDEIMNFLSNDSEAKFWLEEQISNMLI